MLCARTADVLGQAVGGAEDGRAEAAGREGVEEAAHGLRADGLRAAHDELQPAQVPLGALLGGRLPAGSAPKQASSEVLICIPHRREAEADAFACPAVLWIASPAVF